MPNPDQERVIAFPKQIEDLSLLGEGAHRTAGVSRLETMYIQYGSCGSCPSSADVDHIIYRP